MRFYPEEYLKQVMPKNVINNGLLYDDLTLKKTYFKALARAAVIDQRQLNETIYKTIAQYEAKAQQLKEAGVKAYVQEALQDEVLLTQRVKNLLVFDKIQQLKEDHAGEQYRWLPSSAETPDPEHQLLYGKIFNVGEGDDEGNMPGERFGCQCGIEFIEKTPEEKISDTDIDFSDNNYLPRPNEKDLRKAGVDEDKRVLWTQRSLIRNEARHPDIKRAEYNYLTSVALYKPFLVLRDNNKKNYLHFIGKIERNNAIVLLDVENNK